MVPAVSAQRICNQQLFHRLQRHRFAQAQRFAQRPATQGGGKMLQLNHPAPAQHEGVLDNILQLPHVAGEVMFHEPGQHWVGNAGNIFALEPVEPRDEMVNQQRDVLPPVSQARQFNANDMNPIEQVLAKPTLPPPPRSPCPATPCFACYSLNLPAAFSWPCIAIPKLCPCTNWLWPRVDLSLPRLRLKPA